MVTLKEIEAHAFKDPVTHDKLYAQWLEEHGIKPMSSIGYELMRYIERLEAQVKPLTWTTTKPSKPGWYWARWPKQPQLGPEILEVTQPDGPDTDTLAIGHRPCNCTLQEYIDDQGPVEWQGPLEPQEVQP